MSENATLPPLSINFLGKTETPHASASRLIAWACERRPPAFCRNGTGSPREMLMTGRVEGKVALVTGGGSGIGKACALLLAGEGARVVVTDLRGAEAVASEIQTAGGQAIAVTHDVTQEAAWDAVMAAVEAAFGRLDIAVNNAGIGGAADVETVTLAEWRHVMAINLEGVFLGTQRAIAAMKQSGGGSIVNISSIAGIVAQPMIPAYSASKGGVKLFTKSAALHCGRSGNGVRVNSVHPGYILTPLLKNGLAQAPSPEAAHQALVAETPIGWLGQAEDVAYGVLYLASDESRFVTGSELVIDGGYTAQ